MNGGVNCPHGSNFLVDKYSSDVQGDASAVNLREDYHVFLKVTKASTPRRAPCQFEVALVS